MSIPYAEMNWRQRRAWSDENERVNPPSPVTVPVNAELEDARARVEAAFKYLNSKTYPDCADFQLSRSIVTTIQDLLTQISDEMAVRESKGRLEAMKTMTPRQQAQCINAELDRGLVRLAEERKAAKLGSLKPESFAALDRYLADYAAVYPGHEVCTMMYLSQDLPILRDGVLHLKLRHFLHWLRSSSREYVVQSDLLLQLECAGFKKVSCLVHTTDSPRPRQVWYWARYRDRDQD